MSPLYSLLPSTASMSASLQYSHAHVTYLLYRCFHQGLNLYALVIVYLLFDLWQNK